MDNNNGLNPEINPSDNSSAQNLGNTVSPSPVQEIKNQESSDVPATETHSVSATETLFKQNRELRGRLDQLEAWKEQQDRRVSRLEVFIGRISQTISDFFRPKGTNLKSKGLNMDVENEGEYFEAVDSRREQTDLAENMRRNGYSEEEIKQRISDIASAQPFEGGYNLDPANQSKAPQEEITQEQYDSYRPSFSDWQKEQVASIGGLKKDGNNEYTEESKHVAEASAAMRERINTEPRDEQRSPNFIDRFGQTISQAVRPSGYNLDSANQISQKDFATLGQAVDQMATDKSSAQSLVNLYYGNDSNQEQK